MKKFIANIWSKIKDLYNSLVGTSKKYIPIAINIVEAIKKVSDSPVDDIILSIVKAAIPGTADDVLIDKVKDTVEKWLPKILLELRLWQSVSNIENQNEQLQAILNEINLSSDETKSIIYHGLAALILEKLSDGELSWSDSVAISEYYFKNIHKK
jgi:DNA polymerase III delta prime subunit